jgi:hypothetical protein
VPDAVRRATADRQDRQPEGEFQRRQGSRRAEAFEIEFGVQLTIEHAAIEQGAVDGQLHRMIGAAIGLEFALDIYVNARGQYECQRQNA